MTSMSLRYWVESLCLANCRPVSCTLSEPGLPPTYCERTQELSRSSCKSPSSTLLDDLSLYFLIYKNKVTVPTFIVGVRVSIVNSCNMQTHSMLSGTFHACFE